MGKVYAPAGEPPGRPGRFGDFTFLAGEPRADLAAFAPPECRRDYRLLLPQSEGWAQCIQKVYGPRARRITRYATKKGPRRLPPGPPDPPGRPAAAGDALRPIQGELYHRCLANPWSRDLVAQFPTEGGLCPPGAGGGGGPAGGAGGGGLLPMPDTGRGLRSRWTPARTAAARVWLPPRRPPCLRRLDRDLYPSWDAHTPTSLALAEKLGYGFSHGYVAYELVPVSNPRYPTER